MTLSPEEIEERRRQLEARRAEKARRRRRRLWTTALIVIAALVIAAATGYFTYRRGMAPLDAHPSLVQQDDEDDLLTVLFLGRDGRPGAPARADAIMLIAWRPQAGEVGILSIPRDTRVSVPGRGHHRVNVALALGGPDLARQTVSEFLGVPVDYYVEVDFAGFEAFIDAIGGVEMDVAFPMRYDDYAAGLHIDLPAGRQVLNGRQALHYVRYRGGLGDVSLVDPSLERYDGRVVRQLKFVQALIRQLLRPESIVQAPVLVRELSRLVKTDMPIEKMISLSAALYRIKPENVQTALIPGVGQTIGGASYWVADQVKMRKVVDHVVLGRREEQQI